MKWMRYLWIRYLWMRSLRCNFFSITAPKLHFD